MVQWYSRYSWADCTICAAVPRGAPPTPDFIFNLIRQWKHVDVDQLLDVDDEHFAVERLENIGHRVRVFNAGRVVVGPDDDPPAAERGSFSQRGAT